MAHDCNMTAAFSRGDNVREEDVLKKFKQTGAMLEGHFVLSSGLHSGVYLQCALVLQHPREAEEFGQ